MRLIFLFALLLASQMGVAKDSLIDKAKKDASAVQGVQSQAKSGLLQADQKLCSKDQPNCIEQKAKAAAQKTGAFFKNKYQKIKEKFKKKKTDDKAIGKASENKG